jgi:kinetochore protein Mis12/MTW1
MQNILTVQPPALRPHVHLAHYAGLDFDAASTAAADSEGGTAARRRLQASQRLSAALRQEVARNDALLDGLRRVLGENGGAAVKTEEGTPAPGDASASGGGGSGSTFGFLRNRGGLESAGADAPLTTTTEFALSQLQALRALSTSLRTLLPDVADSTPLDAEKSSSSAGGGKKSWRRERAEYVEGASRKYLERTGGLELGSQGEVRDGEYQGSGRNLSRNEVEGLEQVVTILESRPREGSGGGGGDDDEMAEGG